MSLLALSVGTLLLLTTYIMYTKLIETESLNFERMQYIDYCKWLSRMLYLAWERDDQTMRRIVIDWLEAS